MTNHDWRTAFSIQSFMYHAVACEECQAQILKNFLKEFNHRLKEK